LNFLNGVGALLSLYYIIVIITKQNTLESGKTEY